MEEKKIFKNTKAFKILIDFNSGFLAGFGNCIAGHPIE
jgi:hypothetical protein